MPKRTKSGELATVTPITPRLTRESEPGKVNLKTIANLQRFVVAGILPLHRNYLLTSYDDDGFHIPAAYSERDQPWDTAIPKAEARRHELFPDGESQVENYGVALEIPEAE